MYLVRIPVEAFLLMPSLHKRFVWRNARFCSSARCVNFFGVRVPVRVVNSASSLDEAITAFKLHHDTVLGFDLEWKPNYTRGKASKVSVMQLCSAHGVVVIQLFQSGVTNSLMALLSNENIIKTGVGASEDARLFQRDYNLKINGTFNLQYSNSTASLSKICEIVTGYPLLKTRRITCSNWEKTDLESSQIEYAARDAIAGRVSYVSLHRNISFKDDPMAAVFHTVSDSIPPPAPRSLSVSAVHNTVGFLSHFVPVRVVNKQANLDRAIKELGLDEETVLGFDVECSGGYTKTEEERKPALLQLCGRKGVLIVQLRYVQISTLLRTILTDSGSNKVGVGVFGDVQRLSRFYGVEVLGAFDLNRFRAKISDKAGGAVSYSGMLSLDWFFNYVTKKNLIKYQVGFKKDWVNENLSFHQLQYSSADVLASRLVYTCLHENIEFTSTKSKSLLTYAFEKKLSHVKQSSC